jgi:hypothetical protein
MSVIVPVQMLPIVSTQQKCSTAPKRLYRAAVLLAFAGLFVADPNSRTAQAATIAGPETAVSAVSYGPSFAGATLAAAASAGKDYLVFWTTSRANGSRADLYGSAVSSRGIVALPSLIRKGVTGPISAVWAGDSYLAVFGDQTLAAVVSVRISAEAREVSEPSVITKETGVSLFAHGLAWNGEQTCLVYKTNASVNALILDSMGGVEHRMSIPFTPNSYGFDGRLAVTASNGSFAIGYVWQTFVPLVPPTPLRAVRPSTRVEVAMITSTGKTLTPSVLPVVADLPEFSRDVILRSADDRILLALSTQPVFDVPPVGSPRIHRFLLDSATLTAVERPPIDFNGADFAVLVNAGDFLVAEVHLDPSRKAALFTTPMNSAASGRGVVLESVSQGLAVVQSDTAALVVWQGSPDFQVEGKLLTREGAAATSDTFRISMSAQPQQRPAAAIWDDATLVTFVSQGLKAVRLDARGNPIDPSPLLIDASTTIYDHVSGFTGGAWIVAWSDVFQGTSRYRLKLRRVLRDGSTPDDSAIDLGWGYSPRFCTNGSTSLLLFNGPQGEEILPLAPDGLPLLARSRILNTNNNYVGSVGTNGREFLVTIVSGSSYWQFPAPNLNDVNFMRLNGDGAPMDAAPIPIANSRRDEAWPQVASDGRDFIVFFMRSESPISFSPNIEMCARKITREGFLVGVVASDESASSLVGERPIQEFFVARDADHFALAWREYRLTPPDGSDLQLATTDGLTLLEQPHQLAADVQPYIAISAGAGRKVLTYSRDVPELGDVPRVFSRSIGAPLLKRRTALP